MGHERTSQTRVLALVTDHHSTSTGIPGHDLPGVPVMIIEQRRSGFVG
jgi:hypothetical protein